MQRQVLAEILDRLPENHPDALANRRDMRRLNALMGNFRWIADQLHRIDLTPDNRIVELAAGDGSLGRYLVRKISAAREWEYTGIDLWNRPPAWPEPWSWEQADIRTAQASAQAAVIVANHILHQFTDAELRALQGSITHSAQVLIINETARRKAHIWQARCAFLLGMNYVSRHDAVVSVRAGFQDEELPHLLGLDPHEWHWTIRCSALGAYRLVAKRREGMR